MSESERDKIENDSRTEGFMPQTEDFTVRLTSPMLYDRLHILSAEYSVSVEFLVNAAVKRLLGDVDFVRSLRAGGVERE